VSKSFFLCALEDIPDRGARGFAPMRIGSPPLFAVRRGRSVFIYRDTCPHQGAQLAWRRDAYLSADAHRIVCWAHGARFEIESGECTEGPCLGQRLAPVPFEVDARGRIHLKGLA
jgi:nitrite reductase/ring-hydroxylating ferredoxin subunit